MCVIIMERYIGLFEKMKTAFPATTDVRLVMHHILDTLLGEAMKQVSNPKEDSGTAATGKENCAAIIYAYYRL